MFELVIPRLPYIAVYRIHSAVDILAVFHTSTDEPRA
jgi:plasmid stabilization system protein ParE